MPAHLTQQFNAPDINVEEPLENIASLAMQKPRHLLKL
jgi:hypothetical protein